MKNKGIKQKSKKKGSDNAFGCDLIEHLESSGQDGKSWTLLYFLFKPLLFNYQQFLKILVNPLQNKHSTTFNSHIIDRNSFF